jgi:hypothetical protein
MRSAVHLDWYLPLEIRRCPSHYKHYLGVCVITAVLASASLTQQNSETTKADSASTTASQTIAIPDGTPVQLRFAQPVRGKVSAAANIVRQAKFGDQVRLVAAADVRVSDLVVVAKGAIGQATVMKVSYPLLTLTGVALRLDWVEDVTGKHVPLRAFKNGKAQPFNVQVLSAYAGMTARPENLRDDIIGKDAVDPVVLHRKSWIPAGTRILAFVHGTVVLDLSALKDAQILLPISNEIATLTVYRTKGQDDKQPLVFCDGNEIGPIGARHYMIIELTPGKHACRVERQEPLEITAHPGEEYFLRLRSGAMTGGWKLQLVDTAEGEDGIANLELVGKR